MNDLIITLTVSFVTCVACFICVPTILAFARTFGLYVIVGECECRVYTLFGKVEAIISEPGLHVPLEFLGLKALILNFFGNCHIIDLSLHQEYLRSQPVNSKEGAPMGIGVWYEMRVTDPVAYLFKNSDPRGSLRANVSNATVRCLSNLKLHEMLENRHAMSKAVRDEVSPKSEEWGYTLGSVYIRKVHFRDTAMIQQIEQKVVNRLRQVTGAIQQDGINQVAIITSNAARVAATELARAAAMRPFIVGRALHKISQDPEIAAVMFQILENQKILEGNAEITLISEGIRSEVLTQFLAAKAQS